MCILTYRPLPRGAPRRACIRLSLLEACATLQETATAFGGVFTAKPNLTTTLQPETRNLRH